MASYLSELKVHTSSGTRLGLKEPIQERLVPSPTKSRCRQQKQLEGEKVREAFMEH